MKPTLSLKERIHAQSLYLDTFPEYSYEELVYTICHHALQQPDLDTDLRGECEWYQLLVRDKRTIGVGFAVIVNDTLRRVLRHFPSPLRFRHTALNEIALIMCDNLLDAFFIDIPSDVLKRNEPFVPNIHNS